MFNFKPQNEIIPHDKPSVEPIAIFFDSHEQIKNPVQRRDYFEHLDENEFLDLIQQIAGLVRTGEAEHQHFDGEGVNLMTHEVPDQREKEQLLRETWVVAKEFLSDTSIPDQDALDYAALTVAGGVLYTHPFIDGNGRVSRALSYMIARGKNDSKELQSVLANTDGGGNWQITPIPITAVGDSVYKHESAFTGNQPEQITWKNTLAGEGSDALGGVIENSDYRDMIVRKFIEQQTAEDTSLNNDDVSLNGREFIAKLVNDSKTGITNAKKLLEIHREVRAEYVLGFLKAMRIKRHIKPRRIHDGDLKETDRTDEWSRERNRTIINEFGKRAVDGMLTPADQQLIQHLAYSSIRQGLELKNK